MTGIFVFVRYRTISGVWSVRDPFGALGSNSTKQMLTYVRVFLGKGAMIYFRFGYDKKWYHSDILRQTWWRAANRHRVWNIAMKQLHLRDRA